jgi:hypothetical protein
VRSSGAAPKFTRRAVLGGAAVAGAGALIRPSVAAADLEAGRVFARWLGPLAGESPVIDPGRRFALAGVQWSAPAVARIELRTKLNGGRWSPWALASVQGHDPDGRPRSPGGSGRFGEPLWSGGADVIQLRSAGPVDGVRLHFVTPEDSTLALASTAAFPLAQPTLDAGAGQPPIIARSAWAGRQAPPEYPPSYGTVKLAFVHHTVNPNGYTPAAVPAMLLAIFDYHRYVRGFFDIAYNFIIDAFGRIWEARAGGIDEPVIGAQAGGYNAESTGVAVLGTFTSSVPSDRALEALDRLLAWKLSLHGVPALGKVEVVVDPADAFYTPFPPGAHVRLHRISGHREGDLTECPGDAFFALLPSLRPRIATLAGIPAKLTLVARDTVALGTPLELRGRLTRLNGAGIGGAPLEIQRIGPDTETTIATVTTESTGAWAFSMPVARNTTLRALHRPAPASVSGVVTVGVTPMLILSLTASTPPRISGSIGPPKASVTIDTYEVVNGRRRLLASVRVRVRRGRFTARVPFGARRPRRGRFVVIARTAAGGGTLAGESLPLTVDL